MSSVDSTARLSIDKTNAPQANPSQTVSTNQQQQQQQPPKTRLGLVPGENIKEKQV